ncbi:AAA-like domain-containing protein [Chloroflexi bacterium TSY]|nr:AAA-like domain-containing protein [Chloroflexi bacterium TSY]
MDHRTAFAKLRDVLVSLYSDIDSTRPVIDDAALDSSRISLGPTAKTTWHNILTEAEKIDGVNNLIDVVFKDYPNQKLRVAYDTYITCIDQLKADEIEIDELEQPTGTMAPNSPFYVERQADRDCLRYLPQNIPMTIYVEAPRQMGKSSLIQRIAHLLKKRSNIDTVVLNFRQIYKSHFINNEEFFKRLCFLLSEELNMPHKIDQYSVDPNFRF